jgi:alkylation response protein AidB-like acyl-CoA dehydrogenase
MDFDDTPQEAAFRAEVRAWLDANAPRHRDAEVQKAQISPNDIVAEEMLDLAKAWQKTKAEAGWACLNWPRRYGGGDRSPIERIIWNQEEGPYGALAAPFRVGHGMCGPTLMAWAAEDLKQRLLPPLASGEEIWCQLFSEPAGGSDLAGLRTRAVRADNGDWIVNGQKIWTSGAHISDWGLLIARTDIEAPKHKGLTMFFLSMKTPGVEARPIKKANAVSDFNEVYFTDVRIPDAQRLGEVGQGWQVSLTTLMNERASIGEGAFNFPELFKLCQSLELDGRPAVDDPAVRSKLAQFAVRHTGMKYNAMRAISALSRGETPGPENSIGKLVSASAMQEVGLYALDLLGQGGILKDQANGDAFTLTELIMRSPGARIAGGTDEIMRNIIAERVLGLPPDVRVDKTVPFKDIPTGRR